MRVLDLFSGIGGFSLGLERAGMRTVAFCEIEPYCRRVLAKHWPQVPCYDDVRTLTATRLAADGIAVDVIAGGFPCQDISYAGRGIGLDGERSGLWHDFARLVGEIRPRYVIVENVPALLSRGLGRVLGDLAALGFDAEWHCIPAAAIGAPHRRDRIWIVAHPGCERGDGWRGERGGSEAAGPCDLPARSGQHALNVAHPETSGRRAGREGRPAGLGPGLPEQALAHSARDVRAQQATRGAEWQRTGPGGQPSGVANPHQPRLEVLLDGHARERAAALGACWWGTEPDVGRVAYGVPHRVDRLRALGNAVVPQIPEMIGRAILARENA